MVNSTASSASFTLTGSGQTLALGFRVLEDADLTVTSNGSALVLGSDYTVTNAGTQNNASVVMVAGTSGDEIVVVRDSDDRQLLDLVNHDSFDAENVEEVFDRIVMLSQESKAVRDSSFRVTGRAAIDEAGTIPTTGKGVVGYSGGVPVLRTDEEIAEDAGLVASDSTKSRLGVVELLAADNETSIEAIESWQSTVQTLLTENDAKHAASYDQVGFRPRPELVESSVYNAFPSVVVTDAGEWIRVWSVGPHGSATKIVIQKRQENESEWGDAEDFVVAATLGVEGIKECVLSKISDGTLFAVYTTLDNSTELRCYYRHSGDDGATWSAAVALPDTVTNACFASGKIIETTAGTLLCPWYDNSATNVSRVWRSTAIGAGPDYGNITWSALTIAGNNYNETEIVEESDATLHAFARAANGKPVRYVSTDDGATWTQKSIYLGDWQYSAECKPNVYIAADESFWIVPYRVDGFTGWGIAVSKDGDGWRSIYLDSMADKFLYGDWIEDGENLLLIYSTEHEGLNTSQADIKSMWIPKARIAEFLAETVDANPLDGVRYDLAAFMLDGINQENTATTVTPTTDIGGTLTGTCDVGEIHLGPRGRGRFYDNGGLDWPAGTTDFLFDGSDMTIAASVFMESGKYTSIICSNGFSGSAEGFYLIVDDRAAAGGDAQLRINVRGTSGTNIYSVDIDEIWTRDTWGTVLLSYRASRTNKMVIAINGQDLGATGTLSNSHPGSPSETSNGETLQIGSIADNGGKIGRMIGIDGWGADSIPEIIELHNWCLGK